MKQEEYNIIVKCIEKGASALQDELIISLNNLIKYVNDNEKQKIADASVSKKEEK